MSPEIKTNFELIELLNRRPRVALRRANDPLLKLAIKALILNFHTEAHQISLNYVYKVLGK